MSQSVGIPVTTGMLLFGLVAIGQMSNVGLIPRTTGETLLAALRSLRPLLAVLAWGGRLAAPAVGP
jgi:hypothetical protein